MWYLSGGLKTLKYQKSKKIKNFRQNPPHITKIILGFIGSYLKAAKVKISLEIRFSIN